MNNEERIEYYLARTNYHQGCRIWHGAVNSDGYARVMYNGNCNGKLHRIIYELSTGENISGKSVRHSCDTPLCINPDHLISGTIMDNMLDKMKRGRQGTNKIVPDEVRAIRNLYSSGKYLQRELAEMFGINSRTVSSLINRKHWKHVK